MCVHQSAHLINTNELFHYRQHNITVQPPMHSAVSGCLGVWVSGCLGVWVSGCLGVWVSGCLGVWVSGCLGAWMSGCLGVWVSGCTLPRWKTTYDSVEKIAVANCACAGPTTNLLMTSLTKSSSVRQLSLPTLPDESSRKATSTASDRAVGTTNTNTPRKHIVTCLVLVSLTSRRIALIVVTYIIYLVFNSSL